MLENLIYSNKKSLLTKQLEAGNVPENAIAFIGDTKEIYTQGQYFGGGVHAEVNHGTSDTTFTLTPNIFHVWDEVSSLDLSFAEEINGIANEYLFQFTSGDTATTLTLPDGLKWVNDTPPTIAENMIYQISILKGLASVLEFVAPSNITLIAFYFDSSVLQAEVDMTWEEWCSSTYNTTTLRISNGQLTVNGFFPVTDSYGIMVYGTDLIVPNEHYMMQTSGG